MADLKMTENEFREHLRINLPFAYVARSFLKHFIKKYNIRLKNVLDIGSGTGFYVSSIAKQTKAMDGRLTCLEINDELVKLCQRYLNIDNVTYVREDLMRHEFKDTYSLIYSFMVFEHLKDDIEAINRVNSMLDKNGYFLMCVPSDPSRYGNIDKAAGHYRRYDKSDLIQMFNNAGFEVLDVYSFQPKLFNYLQNKAVYSNGPLDDKSAATASSSFALKPKWYVKYFGAIKLGIPLLILYSYIAKHSNLNNALFVAARKR